MKTFIFKDFRFLIFLLLMVMPSAVQASEKVYVAKKSGELRVQNVTTKYHLALGYNYGDMELVFWDKDEVLIKYDECVKAPSQKLAEDVLQKRLALENIEGRNFRIQECNVPSVSFDSKWTVYIPSQMNSVGVRNEFGNVTVGKGHLGQTRIVVKNGDVNVPDSKAMCMIEITQGNFYVGNACYLTLDTKYANGTIGFAQILNVESENAESINIDNAENITIDSKHSKIKVSKAGLLNTKGSYSVVDVGELYGFANIRDMQHSTIEMNDFKGKVRDRGVHAGAHDRRAHLERGAHHQPAAGDVCGAGRGRPHVRHGL